MSEGEKIQFNGNLALLRVCAIVFIVNLLNIVVNMSIMAVRGGIFSSLWSALTNSSFEDLLGTVGLMLASGVLIPFVFGASAIIIFFALGIFALVKKNVKALKILAVLFLVWVVIAAFVISPINGLLGNEMAAVNYVQNFINMVFNVNVVVAVAAFFVTSEKSDLLLRLCFIFFIVSGLNSLANFVFMQPPLFQLAFFGVVNLAVGTFALVKKNAIVLMAGSLMMFVQILLNLFNFIRISGLDPYMAASLVSHAVFNTSTVIAIAVFFIKPEWVKSCLQKMKG